MSSIIFKKRETRAGVLKPDVRSLRTIITSTDSGDKEGDVSKHLRVFRSTVWNYWKKNGRHDLPWRKTHDPYKILLSEIMLQQTQVSRVIEKYKSFLKKFPTLRALAKASLSDVLKEWSGLGYNRRGKYLHDAAKVVVEKYGGKVPRDAVALRALLGIGEYTASAVRVFAFNEPDIVVETNVRTAITYHFFLRENNVSDVAVRAIAMHAAEGQDPRTWQSALFDYGAHLKRSGIRNNGQSKHYTKQSTFEGSLRQVRGAILRELHRPQPSLSGLPFEKEKVQRALETLSRDGLIKKQKGKPARPGWRIA